MSADNQTHNTGNASQDTRFNNFDQDTLPDLRFDDGDTIIKLNSHPRDWLLVHGAVLQAGMPYFNVLLKNYATGKEKSRWKDSKSATHPVTGNTVELATLSLKFADNTLLLSDFDDVVIPGSRCCSLPYHRHSAL